MKTTFTVLGVVMMLFGTIWILQGVNILPGSFMTGQIKWAVYGSIAVGAAFGAIALVQVTKMSFVAFVLAVGLESRKLNPIWAGFPISAGISNFSKSSPAQPPGCHKSTFVSLNLIIVHG